MAKIKFENGITVNFEGNPTPEDIEEISNNLGVSTKPSIPKSLYSLIGAEITPSMKQQFPISSKIGELAQEATTTPLAHFINMALLDYPRTIAREKGYIYPEAKTPIGKLWEKEAGLGGMALSPIWKLTSKISVPKSEKIIPTFIREAIKGGVIGGILPSKNITERKIKAITGATIGGVGGVTIPPLIKNLYRATKGATNFAEDIRQQFYKIKSNAVAQFGQELDNLVKTDPTRTMSLREIVDDINFNIKEMPSQAQTALRKTPILNEMLNKPELADNISVKQAQNIINHLETKIPKNIKYTNLDILDTINDVKAAQLEAYPEMSDIRMNYTKIIEPFKELKKYFKFNKTLQAIEKGFGGKEGLEAVKKLLPQSIINDMGGYKNTINALNIIKKIMKGVSFGGAGYIGYKIARKLFE